MKENRELEKSLPTFDELHEKMVETQAQIEDAKSAVSHSELNSPRDFQSDVSATPKGNITGINLQTPKG